MRLSSILHKHINDGRKTDRKVTLTDKQLCDLWSKATDLESDLINLRRDMKTITNRKFNSLK